MLRTPFATLAVAAALVAAGSAQTRTRDAVRAGTARAGTGCDNGSNDGSNDGRASFCDVREDTIGGANPLDIDASPNGGIRVRGWDRGDVVVRARIQTSADTDADARRIAAGVRIETSGGRIHAEGPETTRTEHWSVSFELQVPRAAMLTMKSVNGGISIEDFRGSADFHTVNGGVSLLKVGGELHGATTNGGVTVDLDGDHWDGSGLDVETHNGGIKMTMPKGYSAELETGTTHGGFSVDFPVTVQGQLDRHITTTLGSGGPKLRAMTTNGGVSIREK